jgi:hypothetical protein
VKPYFSTIKQSNDQPGELGLASKLKFNLSGLDLGKKEQSAACTEIMTKLQADGA